nr:PREDICTED: uncharacterized protein LOC109034841 [Bemisia tabaci]
MDARISTTTETQPLIKKFSNCEVKSVVQFLCRTGESMAEIHRQIVHVYGAAAICERDIVKWCAELKSESKLRSQSAKLKNVGIEKTTPSSTTENSNPTPSPAFGPGQNFVTSTPIVSSTKGEVSSTSRLSTSNLQNTGWADLPTVITLPADERPPLTQVTRALWPIELTQSPFSLPGENAVVGGDSFTCGNGSRRTFGIYTYGNSSENRETSDRETTAEDDRCSESGQN